MSDGVRKIPAAGRALTLALAHIKAPTVRSRAYRLHRAPLHYPGRAACRCESSPEDIENFHAGGCVNNIFSRASHLLSDDATRLYHWIAWAMSGTMSPGAASPHRPSQYSPRL